MDLSFLIPSNARRKLLRFFIENLSIEMGVREIARTVGLSPQIAHRELINLENWGFLFSSKRGNCRAFRVNRKFPLLPSIEKLFEAYDKYGTPNYQTYQTQDLDKMLAKVAKKPIPPKLLKSLEKTNRSKPRAWTESNLLKEKR